MARILVTEEIADGALEELRAAGHDVDVQLHLSPEGLLEAVPGADALVIRSATQVTAEVLEAADVLLVVGRAGIGLDNVDLEAATRRGVMVVNAPQSNIVSAAEHTMALVLAQARNVPQAHAALKEGRWERSQWEGVELDGKTLGIVGLGRIGKLVAQRAQAFGMRLIAFDPFVSADRARTMGVELLSLEQVVAEADFLTIHLPRTKETIGLVGKELLAQAKPTLRVINVARGGIVDEEALAWAVREGIVAGAALDVFATEPTTESPLFGLERVVVTPHLGASTREAQDKAGETIAEMVQLALDGEFVPFAVNVNAAEASETVRPFLSLAERLGRLFTSLAEGVPSTVEVCYERRCVARHARCYGRYQHVLDLEHYLDVLEHKPGAFAGSKPLEQWRRAGRWPNSYDQFWSRLIERHGRQDGTRAMIELLQLGRRLGAARLRSAIESALQLGCADAAAVQHLMATDGLRHQRPSLLLEVGNLLREYERPLPEMHAYDDLLVGAAR